MSVILGNTEQTNFYLGATPLQYIYQGSSLIWATTPPAPTTQYYFEAYGYTGTVATMTSKLGGSTITGLTNVNGNTFLTSSTRYDILERAFYATDIAVANVTKIYGTGVISVQPQAIGTVPLQAVILPDAEVIFGDPTRGPGIGSAAGANFMTLFLPNAAGSYIQSIMPGAGTGGVITLKSTGPWQPFNSAFSIDDQTRFTARGWQFVFV